MPHRLSASESRRLVWQILRRDQPAPPERMLYASVTRRRPEAARPSFSARRVGPYESDYAVGDGYTMERTIIVP